MAREQRRKFIRSLRDKFQADYLEMQRELEHLNAKITSRQAISAVLNTGSIRPVQESIAAEVEKARIHLADLDFYDDKDIETARAITAELRVLKILCQKDALQEEMAELLKYREYLVSKIDSVERLPRTTSA